MKRLLLLGLVACAGAPVSEAPGPEAPAECRSIRLCSFNVRELGAQDERRDHRAIGRMLSACDAVMLEEVRTKGGKAAARAIADAAEPPFLQLELSEEAGHGEGYAFLTRGAVKVQEGFRFVAGTENYARRPATLAIQAGDLDAILVAVHLSYNDRDRRAAELEHLLGWLLSEPFRPKEADVIVLGDFNRYGKSGHEFAIVSDAARSGKLRVPLESTLPDPTQKVAPRDEEGTVIGKQPFQYDQFVVSIGLDRELAGAPRFGQEVGIVAFDRAPEYAGLDHNTLSRKISDHRPIWLRLCVDRGDDD